MILDHLRIYRRTQALLSDDCGPASNAAVPAGAAGPFRDYGPAGAADTAAESAEAALPSEELLAGRSRGRT